MLEAALQKISPRFTRPPTPAASLLIHGAVALLWLALIARAFTAHGLAAWSAGIIYIAYDTFLLLFTFWQTFPLRHAAKPSPPAGTRLTLAVIIAAYNEAPVLGNAITALLAQSDPPDEIILADDGSTDDTAAILARHFALTPPPLGAITPAGAKLRWLRAPHAGKAATLNLALPHIQSDLFVTVDADTTLLPYALTAMRQSFAADQNLVAATGILAPHCDASFSGRLFEWFQTYEYIRNFLGRYAWARKNSLLLISGAFAGFRLNAVLTVGGFDPDCLVEDYELIHRLRRYGFDHALNWHSTVIGAARAITSAPATIPAFLRQRRRWFGGFLQTQYWYRDMVGARKYQSLGLLMLPIKAIDTFQPLYGLFAFLLLLAYLFTGRENLLLPVGGLILAKILLDLSFHLWSIHLYRLWSGPETKANFSQAILAAFLEPFSFQLLRHLGATLGWLSFLTRRRTWDPTRRSVTTFLEGHGD
jgi:cellulose synthase/poly-beta-1,6-N-acetylglucosamine synthase-like glycosyltransferase